MTFMVCEQTTFRAARFQNHVTPDGHTDGGTKALS
jgi:hypothetical protein